MVLAVERGREALGSQSIRVVSLLNHLSEPVMPEPLDFSGGKLRVQKHVRSQLEDGIRVLPSDRKATTDKSIVEPVERDAPN